MATVSSDDVPVVPDADKPDGVGRRRMVPDPWVILRRIGCDKADHQRDHQALIHRLVVEVLLRRSSRLDLICAILVRNPASSRCTFRVGRFFGLGDPGVDTFDLVSNPLNLGSDRLDLLRRTHGWPG